MPDAHWGYGFPIGGVAAMDVRDGVISPGGIGFDINCGMRLVRTGLTFAEVRPKLRELVDALATACPPASAARASWTSIADDVPRGARKGARWAVEKRLRGARGPRAHRGGRLLRRGRSGAGSASGRSSAATARSAPSAPGTTISRSRSCIPRTSSTRDLASAFGLDLPEQVRDHVPLREPRLRPPGGDRLPAGLPARDAHEVRAPGASTASSPARPSRRRRVATTTRPCAAPPTCPSPTAR